jgi:hypothetical protein
MKKIFFLLAALCLTTSACTAFATAQPQAVAPTPPSEADVQATVAFQVEQTLQSMPTPTPSPSNTPVVMTVTSAPTEPMPSPVPTETQNPTLLTLTATLGTGAVPAETTGTVPFTATPAPASGVTPTETNHYQYYGTMPPNLPSGYITMINMSKADVYISLQCTTLGGSVTIIEYPLGGSRVSTIAPAGKYVYVASVGGKKITGNFRLTKMQDLTLIIYKDRIEIK